MILDSEVRIDAISASFEACIEKAVQESKTALQQAYQQFNDLIEDKEVRLKLPPWMREKTKEGLIVFDPGSRIKSAILLSTDGNLYPAQWNISIEPKDIEALKGIVYLVVAKQQIEIINNYKPPTTKNNNIPS